MTGISSYAMHQYPGCYRALGWQPLPAAPAAPTCYHCRDKGTVAVRLSGGRLDTMPCQYCAAGERWAYFQDCADRELWHQKPVTFLEWWLAERVRARAVITVVDARRWLDWQDARREQQFAQVL